MITVNFQTNYVAGTQTTLNGVVTTYRDAIRKGSVWRYTGAVSSFGLADEGADDAPAGMSGELSAGDGLQAIHDRNIVVSDGLRTYTLAIVNPALSGLIAGNAPSEIVVFSDGVPPENTGLMVLQASDANVLKEKPSEPDAAVICFAAGTFIATPSGPKLVEHLDVEDLVLTKDDGVQAIRWIGRRRMTGARFMAMPELRPVRIRRGALGPDSPNRDVWVSPQHRMLLSGANAELLFNTDEVLVAAKYLINDRDITVDHRIPQTEYIHLMFEKHQIIWANGAETESFHPGFTKREAVPHDQMSAMHQLFPDLRDDPHIYGASARRALKSSESAMFLL